MEVIRTYLDNLFSTLRILPSPAGPRRNFGG